MKAGRGLPGAIGRRRGAGRPASHEPAARPSGFFLALVLGAWLAAPVAAQVTLDVMTFNIRTSNVDDGVNAWPHRRDVVVEAIARAAPHILGLQEALDEQIAYLQAMLPEYRWIGVDRGLNGGLGLSEYTPIFYRHRDLSPIASGNFWLTDTPDVPPPPRVEPRRRFRRPRGRIVTWARFYHRASGREVYAFNTHLTLRQGTRQYQSARLIADRVAALPARQRRRRDRRLQCERRRHRDVAHRDRDRGLRDAWFAAGRAPGPAVHQQRLRAAPSLTTRCGASTGSWSGGLSSCARRRRFCTTTTADIPPTTIRWPSVSIGPGSPRRRPARIPEGSPGAPLRHSAAIRR